MSHSGGCQEIVRKQIKNSICRKSRSIIAHHDRASSIPELLAPVKSLSIRRMMKLFVSAYSMAEHLIFA
jgi:hypothetical protein